MLYVHTHILIVSLSHPYLVRRLSKEISGGGPGGGHQGRWSRGSVEQVPFLSPKSYGNWWVLMFFLLEDPFFKWLIWGYPHFRSF